jgi:hypothetical protein
MKPLTQTKPIGEIEDLAEYRDRLRSYTNDELEDIYFRIHVLRHPAHYQLLKLEMERRRLFILAAPAPLSVPNLEVFALRYELLSRLPMLRLLLLWQAVAVSVCAVTFAMLLPLWLIAVPLHVVGIQSAPIYFTCAPIALVLGYGIGRKMASAPVFAPAAVIGAAAASWLFWKTGAVAVIIDGFRQSGTGGGFGL